MAFVSKGSALVRLTRPGLRAMSTAAGVERRTRQYPQEFYGANGKLTEDYKVFKTGHQPNLIDRRDPEQGATPRVQRFQIPFEMHKLTPKDILQEGINAAKTIFNGDKFECKTIEGEWFLSCSSLEIVMLPGKHIESPLDLRGCKKLWQLDLRGATVDHPPLLPTNRETHIPMVLYIREATLSDSVQQWLQDHADEIVVPDQHEVGPNSLGARVQTRL